MRKLIALTAALLVAAAWAIEPPKPQTPPPKAESPKPQTTESAPPPAETAPAELEVEEELPPLPPDTVPAGPPPARFTPTEKVRADFPVSYPIDI